MTEGCLSAAFKVNGQKMGDEPFDPSLSQVCVFVFRTSEIPEIPAGIRCRSATTRLEIDTQAQRAERCVTGPYRGASAQINCVGLSNWPASFLLQHLTDGT